MNEQLSQTLNDFLWMKSTKPEFLEGTGLSLHTDAESRNVVVRNLPKIPSRQSVTAEVLIHAYDEVLQEHRSGTELAEWANVLLLLDDYFEVAVEARLTILQHLHWLANPLLFGAPNRFRIEELKDQFLREREGR